MMCKCPALVILCNPLQPSILAEPFYKGYFPSFIDFEGIHPNIGDLCVSLLGCELHQVPPGQDPTKKRLKLHRCSLAKVCLAVKPRISKDSPITVRSCVNSSKLVCFQELHENIPSFFIDAASLFPEHVFLETSLDSESS